LIIEPLPFEANYFSSQGGIVQPADNKKSNRRRLVIKKFVKKLPVMLEEQAI